MPVASLFVQIPSQVPLTVCKIRKFAQNITKIIFHDRKADE